MELIFKRKLVTGDSSERYDVSMVGGKTVLDLVDRILRDSIRTSGRIYVNTPDHKFLGVVDFRDGVITSNKDVILELASEEVLSVELYRLSQLNDYWIKLKRNIPLEAENSLCGAEAENASDHSEAEKVPAKDDPDLAAEMGVLVKRFEAVVEALQAAQAAMTVFGRIQNIVGLYAEKDRDKTDKQ